MGGGVSRLIIVLADRFKPCRRMSVLMFNKGKMAHEAVLCCAMPVFLTGRGVDGVPCPHEDDVAVAGGYQSQTICAVQRLTKGVGVPMGAGCGTKADHGRVQP